jgi:hypothetical protein
MRKRLDRLKAMAEKYEAASNYADSIGADDKAQKMAVAALRAWDAYYKAVDKDE